jgi:KEOPS complex subunit Pcc1
MLGAIIRISGTVAESAVPAISPEAGRELPRTEVSIGNEGDDAVIRITATDSSAMRAALNSYLECIKIIEDIDKLAKVRT